MKNKYAHISNLRQIDEELIKLNLKKQIVVGELKAMQYDLQHSFTWGKVAGDILSQGLFHRDKLNISLLLRISVLLFKSFRSGGSWMRKIIRLLPF